MESKKILTYSVLFIGILSIGAGCRNTTDIQNQPTNTDNSNQEVVDTTTQEEVPQQNNTSPTVTPGSISSPMASTTVNSPVVVVGTIPGNWATEGQLYLTIENSSQTILGSTTTLVTNWMTTSTVNFSATIPYVSAQSESAHIVIHKGNPSGLPQYDQSINWPITVVTSTP